MGSHKIKTKKMKHKYVIEVSVKKGEYIRPLIDGIHRFFKKYDSEN